MPSDQSSFVEHDYLRANPDVEAAIRGGHFRTGEEHWIAFGQAEGRPLTPSAGTHSVRRQRLLGGLDIPAMTGLEIGALVSPLITPDLGDIIFVDHIDTAALRRKYAGSDVDVDKLVEVDHVWGDKTLADCLGPGRLVDYVLASHVIEHVPDLVTWLQEIASVLKPGGEVRLAVPDRRYTFDILRRESNLAEVLDAFLRRARKPLPRAILDHFLYCTDIEAAQAWSGALDVAALRPSYSTEWALHLARQFHESGEYLDAHCWVFTPHSFAALGAQLAEFGALSLACTQIYPTDPGELEFIARLRHCPDPVECAAAWRTEAARLQAIGAAAA